MPDCKETHMLIIYLKSGNVVRYKCNLEKYNNIKEGLKNSVFNGLILIDDNTIINLSSIEYMKYNIND